MKKVFILLFVASLAFYSFFSLFAPLVHAQQNTGLSLTISPSILDLTANPGDTIKQTFRIRNNTDQPVSLSIIVNKLDSHATNGDIVPVNPQPGDTSPSWFTFDKPTFIANSKEWTEVPFTLTIPKEAAFGYYFALRIGQTAPSNVQNGATTKLLAQIVLPVLLNVKADNAKAVLQLTDFSTSPVSQYLPITFYVTLKNTGNVHLKPAGNIFIRLGNTDTAIIDANPNLGAILPGGTRTYAASWDDGFIVMEPVIQDGVIQKDTKGNPKTHLVINWDKLRHFRIGKYTASVLMVYDNGKRDVPLEATTNFWVFPYVLLGEIFIAVLVLAIIIRFCLKWYIAKEVKKYRSS